MQEKIANIYELENIAKASASLNHTKKTAVYTSNCDCSDSDGCDGDCGSDCYDSSDN
jgi:hypothetical protein